MGFSYQRNGALRKRRSETGGEVGTNVKVTLECERATAARGSKKIPLPSAYLTRNHSAPPALLLATAARRNLARQEHG